MPLRAEAHVHGSTQLVTARGGAGRGRTDGHGTAAGATQLGDVVARQEKEADALLIIAHGKLLVERRSLFTCPEASVPSLFNMCLDG
jgi:hypothetical protein